MGCSRMIDWIVGYCLLILAAWLMLVDGFFHLMLVMLGHAREQICINSERSDVIYLAKIIDSAYAHVHVRRQLLLPYA